MFGSKVAQFIYSCIYWIIPPLGASLKIRTISKRQQASFDKLPGFQWGMSLNDFRDLSNRESERRKVLEDKAKTNVTTVTISVTLVSVLATLINGSNSFSIIKSTPSAKFVLCIFVLAFVYLLLGGLSALKMLFAAPVWGIYLDQELQLVNKDESSRIELLVSNIRLNEHEISKKEAHLASSYQCMFNGLTCILVFVLLSCFFLFFHTQPPSNNENQMQQVHTLNERA